MDTMYYNLTAKRVKVSGGADLVRFIPVPAAVTMAEGESRVLDFASCRQKLETRQAWERLERAARDPHAQEPARAEETEEPAPAAKRELAASWLELAASGAIILMCLAGVLAFLGLA